MATCPECDADIEIDEFDAEKGDQVTCAECGQNLVVTGTDPIELDFASEEDEEDEDDEDLDDDDLDGEDGDEDEDEEDEEDEDWEE